MSVGIHQFKPMNNQKYIAHRKELCVIVACIRGLHCQWWMKEAVNTRERNKSMPPKRYQIPYPTVSKIGHTVS